MNRYNNLDTSKLNYVIYCRKSSEGEDRQIQSLETQLRELNDHAERNRLNIVDIISESKSAFKVGRDGFNKMMNLIKTQKANALLVIRGNRLSRNPIDAGYIISLMDEGKLLYIRTPNSTCYTSSSTDKMMLALELIFSKKDSDDKGDMVKEGLITKAIKGLPSGPATLGFINDKTGEKGDRKWKVDKIRLGSIKILFDMFLTGTYSAGKLYQYAINELDLTTVTRKKIGGKVIMPSRIHDILKDPIYAGFFYKGKVRYELTKELPRLITEEQHNKIKMILQRSNIPKIQKHKTIYSGFISSSEGNFMGQDVKYQLICDCKKKFAYRTKTHCPVCGREINELSNPKYLDYVFYYNVKKKKFKEKYKSISEEKVTEAFTEYAENMSFSKELADWSKKYIVELKNKELNDVIFEKEKLEFDKEKYNKGKARLREMLRDNLITDHEYQSDLSALTAKYSNLDRKTSNIDWFKEMNDIVDLTTCIQEIINSDDFNEKRNLLAKLGSNLVWNEEKLNVYSRKSIEKLVEGIKCIKSEFPEFEPKKYAMAQGEKEKTEPNDPVFSKMLPLLDTFRTLNWTSIKSELQFSGILDHLRMTANNS